MVVRRRKKRVNKMLGQRTRGNGDTKRRRGAGSRGGRGLAGSHKHKYSKYAGKFGKEKKKVKDEEKYATTVVPERDDQPFTMYSKETRDFECVFGDLKTPWFSDFGIHTITVDAAFNFGTLAYLKSYFMDIERKRWVVDYEVKIHSWGTLVHVYAGEFVGTYDLHAEDGFYKFITA